MIKSLFFRLLSICLALVLSLSNVAQAIDMQRVTAHSPALATLGNAYELPKILGYKLDPINPLQIEFIVSKGSKVDDPHEDLMRSVNYFLAALTTSTDKIWVNLSPYESDRVIDRQLEATDIGRDLLSQDYILKQLAASLTNPNTNLGQDYWNNSQNMADLSKIWISPDIAKVYDQVNMVVVTEASLKLESEDGRDNVLLPAITEEVNKGENFARLRQIYNSIILAQTFKTKFINSIYKHYINKGKVNGVEIDDKTSKDRIYSLYLDAFKQGAYNIIKKEYDETLNRKVKRQYFSGGVKISSSLQIETINKVSSVIEILNDAYSMVVSLLERNLENAIVGNYKFMDDDEYYEESKSPILDDMLNTINARVLLIDESVIAREYIKLYLESSDLSHEVIEFENSADAEDFLANDSDFNFIIANDNKLLSYVRDSMGDTMPVIIHSDKAKLDNFEDVQDDAIELISSEELFMEIYPGSKAEYDENYKFVINKLVKPRAAVNPIELEKQKQELAVNKSLDKPAMIDLIANDEKLNIVFVEDDSGVRLSRTAALKRLGNNVIVAEDGLEGFDKISELLDTGEKIDAIVTDNQMPYMTGTKMLTELSEKYDIYSIPTLVQSGTVKEDELIQFGKDNNVLIYEKMEFMNELSKAVKARNQSSSLSAEQNKFVTIDTKYMATSGRGVYQVNVNDDSSNTLRSLINRREENKNFFITYVNDKAVLFTYITTEENVYVDIYTNLDQKNSDYAKKQITKFVQNASKISKPENILMHDYDVDHLVISAVKEGSRIKKLVVSDRTKLDDLMEDITTQAKVFAENGRLRDISEELALHFMSFDVEKLRDYLNQEKLVNFDEQDAFIYLMIESLTAERYTNENLNLENLRFSIERVMGEEIFSLEQIRDLIDQEGLDGFFRQLRYSITNFVNNHQSYRMSDLTRQIYNRINRVFKYYAELLYSSRKVDFAYSLGLTDYEAQRQRLNKFDFMFSSYYGKIDYDTSLISGSDLALRFKTDYFKGELDLVNQRINLDYVGEGNSFKEDYNAMRDFLADVQSLYSDTWSQKLKINLSDNMLELMGDLEKDNFQDVELDIFVSWLDNRGQKSSSSVIDGGITMKDFHVEGMSESSIFNGMDISPLVFENIKPGLVSFSQINDVEGYIKN